jgi:hypothetical protein
MYPFLFTDISEDPHTSIFMVVQGEVFFPTIKIHNSSVYL